MALQAADECGQSGVREEKNEIKYGNGNIPLPASEKAENECVIM